MTDKSELKYDYRILANASVAASYLKQGEQGLPYAKKSLELILKDAKITDPWVRKTVTDPAVMQKALKSQLETYSECAEKETVGDLLTPYENDLKKYLGDNFQAYQTDLESLKDEKFSDIGKQIERADYIIKGNKKHKLFSDEEVKGAEGTINKYQRIIAAIQTLQERDLTKFKRKVEDAVLSDEFAELYKPEEKEEVVA
jgi:hypothetical protein